MKRTNKTVSIIGLGWLGWPLAQELSKLAWQVKGSTTTLEKKSTLSNQGIEVYHRSFSKDGRWNKSLSPLLTSEVLVLTIPPGRRNPQVEQWYPSLVRSVLDMIAAESNTKQSIFTSSTSVYGNQSGLVDETSLLQPVTASARALREAEQLLVALDTPKLILRLAGLYNKDRHPGRWLAGKTNLSGANQAINLIHQEDVIAIIVQLLKGEPKTGVFNLSADLHPRKKDYYPMMCEKLGLKAPTFVQEGDASGKIIDNSLIKASLNYQFLFPDPRHLE